MSIKKINTQDAKDTFADLINIVAHDKERIMLTRRGHDIVALIPAEELQLLQNSQDKLDVKEATDALKETRNGHYHTLEELKADADS